MPAWLHCLLFILLWAWTCQGVMVCLVGFDFIVKLPWKRRLFALTLLGPAGWVVQLGVWIVWCFTWVWDKLGTRLATYPLLGTEVHAWHYTQYGVAEIRGTCVSYRSPSNCPIRSCLIRREGGDEVSVWEHDCRPLGEPLPGLGLHPAHEQP